MGKDAKTFSAIGRRLHGQQWRDALAGDLDVNERTVRRWSNGDYQIPAGVWLELAGLCLRASNELRRFRELISGE